MKSSQFARSIEETFAASPILNKLFSQLELGPQEHIRDDEDNRSTGAIDVTGLAGGAVVFLLSQLYRTRNGNVIYITSDFDEGQNLTDDLANLIGETNVAFYPPRQIVPYQFHSPTGDIVGQRLATLKELVSGRKRIIIIPAKALIEPTIPKDDFIRETIMLRVGHMLEPDDLAHQLVDLGFKPVPTVEEVGDFAKRGGLIDFFSPSHEQPVRAEFFGDEVDSLRYFGVRDQRTIEKLDEVTILPRREIPIRSETIEDHLKKLPEKDADLVRARFICEPDLPGLEWLAVAFGLPTASIIDYMSDNDLFVLNGAQSLLEEMKEFYNIGQDHYDKACDKFEAPPTIDKYYYTPVDQLKRIASFLNIDIHPFRSKQNEQFDFGCVEHPAIGNRIDYLADLVNKFKSRNFRTVITCDNQGQADRLREILSEKEIEIPVEVFHLHAGFISESMKLALLTDHQIFSRQFRRIKRRRYKEGVALASYSNLNPGDIVVHADFGLARFVKLETLSIDGRNRDCLLLHYKNGDKLFVPIEEFNRVSKYAGKDATPKLTALGGPTWDKIKQRTKKALADMAAQLIKLYAERKISDGFKFSTDTVWQRQMEASFPYEETPDQLKAIVAVKEDMQSGNPADRLICGDVGYGKTEVAIRATFKAVENGKQVAILVPTTILAQQHFSTFSARLRDYPMKVAMLSRFRTRAQQKKIVEELSAGRVDVIIGTHRIFSKDISFHDLGLLIVDEEQRFGVAHKEKLRQLKKNVDTITLTATPIPRTLQLSMMGARDMSLIATSPRDRLPINTEITEFNPQTIAEAILREIDRDGQVFFVHNRVHSIDAMYRYLKKLLPQVEIGIAHGQLHEKELEGVMMAFLAGRYQVLLCTTIIESGLDIPTVNTIIINRADHFGLAQLYQLRGRVGRSAVHAHAYLMTPPYRLLTDDARKRLKAIEAHSDLGSGFALAMRDLEIRGAGNILGAKQSGFIEEIGFDLYTKLLEEAVAELKGEKLERLPDTKLEGSFDLHLPDDYVNNKQQKVDIYRRVADSRSLDEIQKIREEVTDRFGRLPEKAIVFFDVAALRLTAAVTGAEKVKVNNLRIAVEYPPTIQFGRSQVEAIRRAIEQPIEFSMLRGLTFVVDLSSIKSADRFKYMYTALDQIATGLITEKVKL